MKKRVVITWLWAIGFCYVITEQASCNNTVDHKNLQLNLYLDLIKYNAQEKLGILPYILEDPNGSFLEVGTGGDPIATLLSKLPQDSSPTIIASDVDASILALLPSRHPQLHDYLDSKRTIGPKLRLQQLDATCMESFSDGSLSGINASAVVHEIVSYAGGIEGLTAFFSESLRVLKPGGVLIYRDPESALEGDELVQITLKTPVIRLFVHIFLPKFLDDRQGKLAHAGRKFKKYREDTVMYTFYKKNEITTSTVTYQDYLRTRSYEIDFSRTISLVLPKGLCREIQRHFLTYLHQCNPLVFVKCVPAVGSELYFVNSLAHSTHDIMADFLHDNGIASSDGMINGFAFKLLQKHILMNTQPLEYGLLVRFASRDAERKLYTLLKQRGIDVGLYLIKTRENECLIDYRIFGLLYDAIQNLAFDHVNGPLYQEDAVHAQWLQREGEETYCYYSDDELIAKVAEISLQQRQGEKPYVLCPLSSAHTFFIPRLCYEEVLKDALEVHDQIGYPVELREGKRVIHFKKMTVAEAIVIYKELISIDPERYRLVQAFIESDLFKNVMKECKV